MDYIGNDGENEPKPRRVLRPVFAKKHPLFAQIHYTLMFSLVRMNQVTQRLENRALARIKAGRAEAYDYFGDIDQYFLFMAYMGNATDQLLKMEELVAPGIGSQAALQKFYDFRHIVIHGPRVPVKFTDFELYVPCLKEVPKEDDWQKGVAWGAVGDKSFMPVTKFCPEMLKEFLRAVNLVHGRVRGEVDNWFEPEVAEARPQQALVEARGTTLHELMTRKQPPHEDMSGRGFSGGANIQPPKIGG